LTLSSIARLLLVGCLLAPGAARAQAAAPATAAGSLEADFGKGAEEVAARLRALARSVSDDAEFSTLAAEVTTYSQRAAETWDETSRLLARNLRTTTLDSLTTAWQAFRGDLEDVSARIAIRARRREADLSTLTALHESWARSLDLARKADAPPAVVDRIQNTLASIDRARPPVEQRRAEVLVLQDSVTRALDTTDDALARVADARGEAIKRLFTAQLPPLWEPGAGGETRTGGRLGFAADISGKLNRVELYARAYRGGLVLSVVVILVLMVVLRRGRSQRGGVVALGTDPDPPLAIFRTPYAAAILIGLLVTRPFRPIPPFELQQLILAIIMTAAVLVFRPIIEGRVAAAVYLCCALLAVSLTGAILEPNARLEQVMLVVEMIATAGIVLWVAAEFAEMHVLGSAPSMFRRFSRTLTRVLAIGCGASAVAAAFGYLDLADFVGLGLFYVLLLTFGVLAIRVAAGDVVTIAASRGPLARLRAVARHRALIERHARSVLDAFLIGAWTWVVLARFQLLGPITDVVRGVLDARLRAGELDLPVSHVLAFVAVVVGVLVVTRVVGTLLEEDVYSRMTLPRGVPYALSTLTRYTLLLAGFLLALATLGLDLTRITVLVSALGLGLGFGLQQIMNNFVSGLILLFERPVNVGDSIQMGDLSGDVLRIGIRSSTVRTSQGAEVIVPNSKMIEEKVTNWTLSDRRRRIELDIGVKGDVDAERIIAILGDVAARDPRVSRTPAPEVLLVRFGEDATDFQLRFWTDEPDWTRLRSDLSIALQRALRAARVGDEDAGKVRAEGS
jgi:small-conductance mechanosensitive channel